MRARVDRVADGVSQPAGIAERLDELPALRIDVRVVVTEKFGLGPLVECCGQRSMPLFEERPGEERGVRHVSGPFRYAPPATHETLLRDGLSACGPLATFIVRSRAEACTSKAAGGYPSAFDCGLCTALWAASLALLGLAPPPRNSLRSLRSLRSDSLGEFDGTSALRARATSPALLGAADSRRRVPARVFAVHRHLFARGAVAQASSLGAGTTRACGARRERARCPLRAVNPFQSSTAVAPPPEAGQLPVPRAEGLGAGGGGATHPHPRLTRKREKQPEQCPTETHSVALEARLLLRDERLVRAREVLGHHADRLRLRLGLDRLRRSSSPTPDAASSW